jgi:hypothetical protein
MDIEENCIENSSIQWLNKLNSVELNTALGAVYKTKTLGSCVSYILSGKIVDKQFIEENK